MGIRLDSLTSLSSAVSSALRCLSRSFLLFLLASCILSATEISDDASWPPAKPSISSMSITIRPEKKGRNVDIRLDKNLTSLCSAVLTAFLFAQIRLFHG